MTGCTSICNQGRDCTCVEQHCAAKVAKHKPLGGGNVFFPLTEEDLATEFDRAVRDLMLILSAAIAVGVIAFLCGLYGAQIKGAFWHLVSLVF